MFVKLKTDVNEIFVQALYTDDMPLLKTIIEGMKYTRINHLQSMFNAKSELGDFTPFEYACLHGNSTLATMLIDTGKVDLDRIGQCKWTPLHAAAYSGDLKTVQVLLNSCANCFARDENNNLPLDLTKDVDVQELLSQTMKRKNIEKFNEVIAEHQNKVEKKKERFQQRSKSCFANVSVIKMNELKTRLNERKQSTDELIKENGQFVSAKMSRWKTYSDLSLKAIFELTS